MYKSLFILSSAAYLFTMFYLIRKTTKEFIQLEKDSSNGYKSRILNLKEVISSQFTIITKQRQTIEHLVSLKSGDEELKEIAEWLMEYENSGRIGEEDTIKEIDKIITNYFKEEREDIVS